MKRKYVLLTVIFLLLASNAGTYMIATGRVPFLYTQGVLPEGIAEYRAFLQVLGYIQRQFVDAERAADATALIQGATSGMVEALRDPYSQYMTATEYQRFMSTSITGSYAGVGIEITQLDGYVTVIAPIKNTPAYRAGVVPMDRILAVDGVSITGWTTQEASGVIRGTPGTTVVLTIRREGVTGTIDIPIVREMIQLVTVESRMIEPGIGYIQLTAFREDTTTECRRAIEFLQAQGMRSLILDLRDNPGGLLNVSIEISDMFVPPGPVVSTVYRDGRQEQHQATQPALGVPMVVLINRGSASAAEITAGAIQDRGAGQLIGVRSFGKATVQHLFALPDGGGLKLTTAKYLTPNGRDINRSPDGTGGGIMPDIEIENLAGDVGEQRMQLDDPADYRNEQLREALRVARQLAS